jgi:dimethylhistidine N-methyltransferase
MIPGKQKSTTIRLSALRELPAIAGDVLAGLTANRKRLHPKWFYDARGSELFELITETPEYYLTRTEQEILRRYSGEMLAAAGNGLTLIELGAGSATKTGLLIEALLRRQLTAEYVPVDVSRSALLIAARRLRQQFPRVRVRPHVTDFTVEFPHMRSQGAEPGVPGIATEALRGRKLVLFIGSSIGNFEPAEAMELLRRLRAQLEPGDALLLGTDLVKSPEVLIPAYDDANGVTAQFNKNVLARINRELDANFDLASFRHVAEWNASESRMEMHLESSRAQRVCVGALGMIVAFQAGERIHTENSYKYTLAGTRRLLRGAGFGPERVWTDEREWFAVHLARAL